MADTDTGPELPPTMTPGAQAALLGTADPATAGDDQEAKLRRELYRKQIEEEERLTAREEETYRQRNVEMDKRRRDVEAAQAEQSRIGNLATGRYLSQQKDVPEPPQWNSQQAQTDALAWMSLAAGFGAIAGGLSRYHTTTALNAFAGMTKGFAEGEIQAFNENYKVWQANTDKALEYNNRAQREYRAIMDNAKLNVDQKANLMEMTANKWQDQIMAESARGRHLERMTQLMDAQARFEENLKLNKQKVENHEQEWKFKAKVDLAKGGMVLNDDGSISIDTSPSSPAYKRAEQIAAYNQPMPNNPGGRYAGMFNELAALVDKISMEKNGAHYDATRYAGKISYSRAAGTYGARVETATNEVAQLLPQALEASKAEPRGKWVPINKLVQDLQAGKSDPRYYDFAFANFSLINVYGRAINPTGVARLEDKQHAAALLSTATDQASYERVLLRLAKEVRASHAAVAMTRGEADAHINAAQNIMQMSDQQLEQYIVTNAPQANTVASGKLADSTAGNRIRITIPAPAPTEDSEFPGFSIALPPQQQ